MLHRKCTEKGLALLLISQTSFMFSNNFCHSENCVSTILAFLLLADVCTTSGVIHAPDPPRNFGLNSASCAFYSVQIHAHEEIILGQKVLFNMLNTKTELYLFTYIASN